MIICKNIKSLQEKIDSYRLKKHKISFVPTMGSLHKGHLSLVKKAKGKNKIVIVSIFVNPTQFGVNEDFKNYPRNTNKDIKLLKNLSVDIVFVPYEHEILKYKTPKLKLSRFSIERILCGKSRPQYFPGVGNIIIKFFDIIKPNYAYFGEKDYQQYYFIKLLTAKLKFNTKIISCKTIRDNFGIALSSRNLYLNNNEKKVALNIIKILRRTKRELSNHWRPKEIIYKNKNILLEKGVKKIDYFELRSETLKKNVKRNGKSRLFIAAFIGSTRLIDNLKVN